MSDLTQFLGQGGFDSSEVEPDSGFEPIEPGKYVAMIVASEMKKSKTGGQFLELRFEIVDGPRKGRLVFDRLNLVNQNEQAVHLSKMALSAICRATGVLRVKDSRELHNKPIVIDVRIGKARDGYDPSNEIKGYAPVSGTASKAKAAPKTKAATSEEAAATEAPAPSAPKKPWEK